MLEPSAMEFDVDPGDFMEFFSDAELPAEGYWSTECESGVVVVFPESGGGKISKKC